MKERLRQLWRRFMRDRFTLAVAAILALLAAVVLWPESVRLLQSKIEQPFGFTLRSLVRGPGLDPRIKGFAYDDRTVAKMKGVDIPLADWAKVFKTLQKAGARGVLIDKIFDAPYTPEEIAAFRAEMHGVEIPIVSIAFLAAQAIPFRNEIRADRVSFKGTLPSEREARLAPRGNYRIYGASDDVLGDFAAAGFGNYDGDGRFRGFVNLGDNRLVPHAVFAFLAAVRVSGFDLSDSLRQMPVQSDSTTLINLDRRDVYLSAMRSFLPLVERARLDVPITTVVPGDLAVIITGIYTGNTDFKATPLGIMPGGFTVLAILSGALRSQWVQAVDQQVWFFLLFATIGTFIGLRLRPLGFAAALVGLAAAWLGAFALAIMVADVLIPLVAPLTGLLVAGIAFNTQTARRAEFESIRMQVELKAAQSIQMALIPPADSTRGELRVYGHYRAATECAGDFWTIFSPEPGRHYIVVGDATGHGVGPALISAIAHATAENLGKLMAAKKVSTSSGSELLSVINDNLRKEGRENTTMTLQVAIVDEHAGTIEIANAGHPFPIIVNSEGAKVLNLPSDILGVFPAPRIRTVTLPFPQGAKMVLFSDGVYEITNAADVQFGRYRLMNTIRGLGAGNGEQLRKAVVEKIEAFAGNVPLADDVTLVILERMAA